MEVLNLLLAAITAMLGLPIGFLLAKVAKEELKQGEFYFNWMQIIILILAVNIFFYSLKLPISTFILIFIITSSLIIKSKPKAVMGYILLAVLVYLRLGNDNFIITAAALTFLYGLPTAALIKREGIRALKTPLSYIKKETMIIGHRGAPKHAPENTIGSIKKAIELGADMIEIDTRLTKDKKIVIMHDHTVNRTTNGKGNVNNLTLKEIKKLKTKNNESVPTLQEVVSLLKKKKIEINIHIKDNEATDRVVNLIKKNNFQRKTMISSFDEDTLERVKKLSPAIRTAYAFAQPKLKCISIGKKLDVYAIHPMYNILTERMVLRAHKNGFKVNVWTIRSKLHAMKAKFLYRVDGLITDDPLLYTRRK
ncbi:MAG: glycerophosphodiester phosphodiesterase family protein [Candidatus Woesearchaeota archaeon]